MKAFLRGLTRSKKRGSGEDQPSSAYTLPGVSTLRANSEHLHSYGPPQTPVGRPSYPASEVPDPWEMRPHSVYGNAMDTPRMASPSAQPPAAHSARTPTLLTEDNLASFSPQAVRRPPPPPSLFSHVPTFRTDAAVLSRLVFQVSFCDLESLTTY